LKNKKQKKTRNLQQKTTLTWVTASLAKNKDEIESKQKTTEAPLETKNQANCHVCLIWKSDQRLKIQVYLALARKKKIEERKEKEVQPTLTLFRGMSFRARH